MDWSGSGSNNACYTLIRDSTFGHIVFWLSGKKILKPVVVRQDYCIPEKYTLGCDSSNESKSSSQNEDSCGRIWNGKVIVDWDGPNDPDNPYNWPITKKVFVALQIAFLTLSSYMASAIFTPAEQQMLDFFGTTEVKLMLGLSMFVWGYGISPMFVSAMSESPSFGGRRWIFLISQLLFVVLQIPTALTNSLAPFAVLRFLAGLCSGAPLSNAPACISDTFAFPSNVYVLMVYAIGAVCGPFLGPLIGAALTNAAGWRWVFWFLLIQGASVLAVMFFFLPETSSQALLMRKARYLRARTGNPNIISRAEIKQQTHNFRQELVQIVWYPIELCLREPVLDLVNLHLTLIYSVVYLFFEGFPLVFQGIYHFPIVSAGATYLTMMVGIVFAIIYYYLHLEYNLIKPIQAGKPKTPEVSFGYASLVASFGVPTGLFIFGWSATKSAHWIGPLIGAGIFQFGTFILFQSYYAYLATLYPTRYASALSSSTVIRSVVSAAFPLFGKVFFEHTGTAKFPVGWGCSILGFVGIAMIGLPVYFIFYGPQLRERARAKYGAPEDQD